jgi:lipopolysaccharide export LptBFGC system permease protein LptF
MTVQRWTDEMLDKLAGDIKENTDAIKLLREESKEQGIRFAAYQQSSQWVVNLAFALIASATVTTLASAIFRR